MAHANKNVETESRLYDYTSFQNLEEAEASLKVNRTKQKDLTIGFEKLILALDEEMASDIRAIRSLNVDNKKKKELIEMVENQYRSKPETTVYFEGEESQEHMSHMVVRQDENSRPKKYPLADLAKETTLYKNFNLNQRTMEMFSGKKQAELMNYLLNEGVSNQFRGTKKIRLNHLGEVRSVHSKQYKFLDNLEVIERVKDFIEVDEASRFDIVLDEKFMMLNFVFKNFEQRKYKGDVMSCGLSVFNSEVGLGSLQVNTLLNVNDTRFIVAPSVQDYKFREVHKGYDPGESLESFSNHLDFAANFVIEILNKYKTLYNIRIDKPNTMINNVCGKYHMLSSKKVRTHLMEEAALILEKNGELTYRDIVHLVANVRTNKRHDKVNTRYELQKVAGHLINASEEEILELLVEEKIN